MVTEYRTDITYADKVPISFGMPYMGTPSEKELGRMSREEGMDFLQLREAMENGKRVDPVKWNTRLPVFEDVVKNWCDGGIHVILGGNRSGKTFGAANIVVEMALKIPECEIICFSDTTKRSIDIQQREVYDAFPDRFKRVTGHSKKYNLGFGQKDGFVDNVVIFPPMPGYKRGSKITFMTYMQYRGNPQAVEGVKAHLIWCDEEVPSKLFNTLQMRLTDYKGKMLLTFTTLNGYTALVRDLLMGAKTIKERYAKLVGMKCPTLQKLHKFDGYIYYAWTEDNPYIPYPNMEKQYKDKSREEILCRFYGVPSRRSLAKFPRFKDSVHVIKKYPWEGVEDKNDRNHKDKFTRYMVIDPAGSKNWFIVWVAVGIDNRVYVYREFPDIETYGAWAVSGDNEEEVGMAQKGLGWGIGEYVDYIKKVENGESIAVRLMDPRLGNTPVASMSGTSTIIQNLLSAGMMFIPAPGSNIEEGLQRINDLLSWEDEKETGVDKKPLLYFHISCGNTIAAIQDYIGDGQKDPHKDPIDCLRYLFTSYITNMSSSSMEATIVGGGSY